MALFIYYERAPPCYRQAIADHTLVAFIIRRHHNAVLMFKCLTSTQPANPQLVVMPRKFILHELCGDD